MAMGPMPPQGGAPEPDADNGQPQAGGAAELVAGIGSDLMKLNDMVGAKFPDEGAKLGEIIQAYQSFVDGLSAGPDKQPQGPAMPGTTTPEAGAASVKPVM